MLFTACWCWLVDGTYNSPAKLTVLVLYTMFGGIKATFLTDYVHTVMILVILLIFAFSAYATNASLGSPGRVYDLLVAAAEKHPVDGNAGGSYLTMRSYEGAVFFVINIVSNLLLCLWVLRHPHSHQQALV